MGRPVEEGQVMYRYADAISDTVVTKDSKADLIWILALQLE